jgi:hypothetical protein
MSASFRFQMTKVGLTRYALVFNGPLIELEPIFSMIQGREIDWASF